MKILFRADGNAEIGAGHIMRCLSLAQAIQDNGGEACFLSFKLDPSFQKRLKEEGVQTEELTSPPYSLQDADEVARVATELNAEWVVLDGYSFDDAYQKKLKALDVKVLCIDDEAKLSEYSANIILNQNPHASGDLYSEKAKKSLLLLGTVYSMLRREFRTMERIDKDVPATAKNILITLGGSDPRSLTLFVMKALDDLREKLEITVIVGGANPRLQEIQKTAEQSKQPIQVLTDVKDMPGILSKVDLAITATGSTTYELAFMGIPTLGIIVAENQQGVATGMENNDAMINLGWHDKLTEKSIQEAVSMILNDPEKRKSLMEHAQSLVDGQGADRVLLHMTGKPLRLREAIPEDSKMIWEWANDPETRLASFSSEPIPWEDHQKWFEKVRKDPNYYILVGVDADDTPLGQIRFEVEGKNALISINLAPGARGKGLGKAFVETGIQKIFRETAATEVHAEIKPENAASIRLFESCGFEPLGEIQVKGLPALHFVQKKDSL